jgi:hypothetical protein
VYSTKEHGVVRVMPASTEYDDRIIFNVAAFNNGPNPANLGVENITVTTEAGEQLVVYSYEKLVKEAKNRAAWAVFAVALSGAANSYAAQQSAYTTTNGSIVSSSPYGSIHTSYYGQTYNPGVANLLQQENNHETSAAFNQISAGLDAAISQLNGHLLRTTTVDVGQIVGGQVVIEKPKLSRSELSEMNVTVAFNGETHSFKFKVGDSDKISALPPLAVTETPKFEQPMKAAPAAMGPATSKPAGEDQMPAVLKAADKKKCGIFEVRPGVSKLVPCTS